MRTVLVLLTLLSAAAAAAQPPAATGGVCPYLLTYRGGYAGAPAASAGVSQVSHPSPRTAPMVDAEVAALELLCLGLMPGGSGATPPATCELGQQWYDTDATAGERLLCCDPVDTWTLCLAGGGGGGGAVDSVFGRTGAVVAAASDYDASLVDNDSGVAGATVAAALDTLAAGKAAVAHAAAHSQGGADAVNAENLASVCGAGAPLEGDGAGGVQCGTDDTGTDDQTASEVPITDAGAFFSGADVEAALQEVGPTMADARTPTAHATSHQENGTDELLAEDLGTACADGELLKANPTGGLACGTAGSASFTTLDGDYGDETVTSTWNLDGAVLALPNSTAPPSADCDDAAEAGRVHVDTSAPSGQQLYVCEGATGWVLQGGGGAPPALLFVRDEKTSGTAGGAAGAATWNVRTLNAVAHNSVAGASLSSNQVTLPAGTYRIRASAPAFSIRRHQLRLRNITDTTTAAVGTSEFTNAADSVVSRSALLARITITGTKVFELQHYTQDARATDGLGPATSSGEVEVYAELWIEEE